MKQNSNVITNQKTIITQTHRFSEPKIMEMQLTAKQKAAENLYDIICMLIKRQFYRGIEQINNYNFKANRKNFVHDNFQRGYRLKSQDNSKLRPRARTLDPYAQYSRARLLKDIIGKLKAKKSTHHISAQNQSVNIEERIHQIERIFQESMSKDGSSHQGDESHNAMLYELMTEVIKLKRQLAKREQSQTSNRYPQSISNISRQSQTNNSLIEQQKLINYHSKKEPEPESKKLSENAKLSERQSETVPYQKHISITREYGMISPEDSKQTQESKHTQKFPYRAPPKPSQYSSSPSRPMSYQGTQQKIQHKYSEPHFKTVYQEEKKNPQESRGYYGHVPPAPIYNIHQNPISIHQNPVTINHHTVTNIQQPQQPQKPQQSQQPQQPQQFQQAYGEKYRPKPPEYFHSNMQRQARSNTSYRPVSEQKPSYSFNAYPNKVVTEIKRTYQDPKITELKQPFRTIPPQTPKQPNITINPPKQPQPHEQTHKPQTNQQSFQKPFQQTLKQAQTTEKAKVHSPQPIHFVQKKPFKMYDEKMERQKHEKQEKNNKGRKLNIMSSREQKPLEKITLHHHHDPYCDQCGRRCDCQPLKQ